MLSAKTQLAMNLTCATSDTRNPKTDILFESLTKGDGREIRG